MRSLRLRLLLRRLGTVLSAAVVLSASPGYAAAAAHSPEAIHTNAKAAALIDVASGRLLYSSQGDRRMKIASLTKIMTAVVALENGRLEDQVKAGPKAVGKEGSSLYLKLGERMSLGNMLYGLMLRSGNDAATAIAEHVGGTEEGFVHLMNEKAERLGLTNTHFMNPHGLDHKDHYSSANDMARLTAYALHNPVFREIVKTQVKSAPNPNESWDYKWYNKNKMLRMYEGADGVKTGYTKTAFRCLVSSATRNGQQLAAVTLNDGDDWADHRKLLDWGFAHYPLRELVSEGDPVAGQPYEAARPFRYPLADGEERRVKIRLEAERPDTAAYRLGYAGRLRFALDGRTIGSVPVRAVPAPEQEERKERADRKANASRADSVRSGFAADWLAVIRALFA